MKRIKMDEAVAALILKLEKSSKAQKAPFWAAAARHLSKPHRSMAEVDVKKLASVLPNGSMALVPGAVIGSSKLEAPLSVAALRFTAGARTSITKAGGKCLTIGELLEKDAKGTNISLIV